MSRETPVKTPSEPSLHGTIWPVRIASYLLAIGALIWVYTVFPDIADPQLSRIAGRIASGETYDRSFLHSVVADNTQRARESCNPASLRQLLILQISATDNSVHSTDFQTADADMSSLDKLSRELLACAPTEAVGWLGLYWVDIQKDGLGPKALALLGQSFHFAPHEAWIQLIRGPLALRSFDALPPKLKDAAAQDFEDIFQAQLYPSAALLFKYGSSAARQNLLDRTCNYTEDQRALFRHFMSESGIAIRHPCYPPERAPLGSHS